MQAARGDMAVPGGSEGMPSLHFQAVRTDAQGDPPAAVGLTSAMQMTLLEQGNQQVRPAKDRPS